MAISYCVTATLDWGKSAKNYLVNGGFNFAQLYDSTIATSVASGAITADAWRVVTESGGPSKPTYQRNLVTGGGFAEFNSAATGHYDLSPVVPDRAVVYQIIPYDLTQQLRGQDLTFNISVVHNGAFLSPGNYNFSAMILTSANGADTVGTVTPSWASSGVSPTFSTLTILADSGPQQIAGFANFFAGGNQLSVSTCALNVSTVDNLIVAIAVDDPSATFFGFDLAQAGLYIGASNRPYWNPLPMAEDAARCETFIEKSYDIDTVPGAITNVGAIEGLEVPLSPPNVLFPPIKKIEYRKRKIITPTITYYNPTTGLTGTWRDSTAGTNVTTSSFSVVGKNRTTAQIIEAGTTGNKFLGHYVIDGSL